MRNWGRMAMLAAAAALSSSAAWSIAQAQTGSGEPAVWVPKQLTFQYRAFTTQYSCNGLQDKMKWVLQQLGARDIEVGAFGCTQLIGPDPFAGVSIKMQVLQPVVQGGAAVPAQWKRVDLLASVYDRDPADAARDCELIYQIKQSILPLFATRNTDYSAACEHHNVVVGGTRLKTDVLVPAPGAPAQAAAR
jgi:hypothetical protein